LDFWEHEVPPHPLWKSFLPRINNLAGFLCRQVLCFSYFADKSSKLKDLAKSLSLKGLYAKYHKQRS
jgi:hypothetical protein